MASKRIPFAVAISEPRLLQARFLELSPPQRAILKILYGCELEGEEKAFWPVSQDYCEWDELGYTTEIGELPYVPKTYSEAWIVGGRRVGKSSAIASTIVVYEAALGGHEERIRPGQQGMCFQIAQDLRMAMYSLHDIKATLEQSPILAKQIVSITANRIRLKNGLTISTVPPTLKAVRGYACPVAVLDEVGVWYQDSDSANPDYEIYRALKPAQAQFPNRMLVGISSPWNKSGLLYQYSEAGTEGRKLLREEDRQRFRDCLVIHVSTAAGQNPKIDRSFLVEEQARDPKAFEREYLALFQDSISGFLNTALLKEAVDHDSKGDPIVERPPEPGHFYVAALDPAFRRDAFGFTICHADEKRGIVQDVIRRWKSDGNTPLEPQIVLLQIKTLLQKYRIPVVYSDQYHLESLQQLALNFGFAIEGVDFTGQSKAAIFGNLQSLVNQKRIHLVDHPELVKELRSLEMRLTKMGTVQISAPQGGFDDLAAVTALASYKATWLLPSPTPPEPPPPTLADLCLAQIGAKNRPLVPEWELE